METGPRTTTTTTTVHRPTGWLSWMWSSGWHALEYIIPAPAGKSTEVKLGQQKSNTYKIF